MITPEARSMINKAVAEFSLPLTVSIKPYFNGVSIAILENQILYLDNLIQIVVRRNKLMSRRKLV